MPSAAHDVVDFAPPRAATPHRHPWAGRDLAEPPFRPNLPDSRAGDRAQSGPPAELASPVPLMQRRGDGIDGHLHRVQRRLAGAVSRTTPTQLPELLRAFSRHAGRLAHHPVNAFDNNPFIAREWLIVSQVLHAAAHSLENRFEALFLGP